MELRQLECFVAVAEESSFTRAATRLHVVQPAVSATIASLERELQAKLLIRTTRQVRLTDAGRELLPEARATLDAARDARDAVHAVQGGLRGTLRIGTMSALGPIDLPELLGRFHRTYPDVSINLATAASCGGSPGLITALTEGRLDLAFVSLPAQQPPAVQLHDLARTPLDLVVPRDHRLAGRGDVTITELAGESFVEFPAGYGNRAVTDRAFTTAGIQRHVAIETTSVANGADFVRHRLGVALLPRTNLAPDDDLAALPVTGADLDWPVSLATPAGHSPGLAARRFEELAAEHVSATAPQDDERSTSAAR